MQNNRDGVNGGTPLSFWLAHAISGNSMTNNLTYLPSTTSSMADSKCWIGQEYQSASDAQRRCKINKLGGSRCAEKVPEDVSWSHFFCIFKKTLFRVSIQNFCPCFTWYHWATKFLIFFLPIIIQNNYYDVQFTLVLHLNCTALSQSELSNFFMCIIQGAKKVVSDSPGLVDFVIGLVNSVLNLPDGQAKIFRRIQITKYCKTNVLNS